MAKKTIAFISESKSDYYEFITVLYVLNHIDDVSIFYYGSRPANTNTSTDSFLRFENHYKNIGFDAIIFFGEKGTRGMINEALRETYSGGVLGPKTIELANKGGLIASIGEAIEILGKLGLLKGKKYTCLPGLENNSFNGTYTGKEVEKDGNIITAKGPSSSYEFALAIVEHLFGQSERNRIDKEFKGIK